MADRTAFLACVAVCVCFVSAVAATCSSEDDCSLLGDCVNGACVCDQGWRGEFCEQLDIIPGKVGYGYHNQSAGASWGTGVIYADGQWHAFIAEMVGSQPLSQIACVLEFSSPATYQSVDCHRISSPLYLPHLHR